MGEARFARAPDPAASTGPARTAVPCVGEPGRVILWDLDGTIVDTSRDLAAAVNRMLAEYGWPPLPVPVVVGHIGKGAQNLVARCLEEYGHRLAGDGGAPPVPASAPVPVPTSVHGVRGVARAASEENRPEDTVAAALAVFERHYAAHLMDETEVYPGVAGLLQDLARAGRRMAIVTNKPEGFSREIVDRLGLGGCFQAIVGGETLAVRKPAPEPLWHATRLVLELGESTATVDAGPRSGAKPDWRAAAVMVGDTWIDAEAARAAGVPVILVGWGLGDRQRARAAAPDVWVESAAELGEVLGLPA